MLTTTHPKLKFKHPSLFPSNVASIDPTIPQSSDRSPESILNRLIQGNQRFIKLRDGQPQIPSIRLCAVAKGETPVAAILNYAQLTTTTEQVFGQKFGELFVINSPGQLTNFQEISGIEYGVLILGISVVVVLGGTTGNHKQVSHASENSPSRMKVEIDRQTIRVWGRTAQTPAEAAAQAKTNILDRVARLKASPLLARFIQAGELKIVAGLYDENQGSVIILE